MVYFLFSGPQKKTMTAKDVTGFCAFFSPRKSGNFLHILAAISLPNYTVNLGKQEKKNPLEKIQINPVETAPRNCRFLSLVVVGRVLIIWGYFSFLFFWAGPISGPWAAANGGVTRAHANVAAQNPEVGWAVLDSWMQPGLGETNPPLVCQVA